MKNRLAFVPNIEATAPSDGARPTTILGSRIRAALGDLLNRMRLPGAIQPMCYSDPVTGDLIDVGVYARFTKVSINGRDYYFDRITGQFDGTGMGCA